MIDATLAWCGQNGEIAASVLTIILTLIMKGLNRRTGHHSEYRHVVKLLLWLVDLLDFIKNTPAPQKPLRGSSIKRGPTFLLLSLLLVAGCASTFSGKLSQAHTVINGVTTATLKVFHAECLARAKACKAGGVKKALDCAPWRECDNARAGLVAAVRLVEDGLLALDQAAKQAKTAGVLP